MAQYTKEEMKTLNRISRNIFGCDFTDLDFEDQSDVLCMMFEERGF